MTTHTIRLGTVNGRWVTLGAGELRGLAPSPPNCDANDWGPATLTFSVPATQARMHRSDLLPFTLVEWEANGVTCFNGRILTAPWTDGPGATHQVQCEGLQANLDDDYYDKAFVAARLSDWRDQRSFLSADLSIFVSNGQVNSEGSVALSWPVNATLANGDSVGVTLDLGPSSTAKRIIVTWARIGASDAAITFETAATATEDATTGSFTSIATLSTASGTSGVTYSTARRYAHLRLRRTAGATLTADHGVQITSILVVAATAYESGNASVLNARDLIIDALGHAPLLSQDTTLIQSGSFAIPAYVTGGLVQPRAVMQAANAFEDYRLRVSGEKLDQVEFAPRPTIPVMQVGAWPGSSFSETGVSGAEVATRVIVDGRGFDGAPLRRTINGSGVTLADKAGVTKSRVISLQNPATAAEMDLIGTLYLSSQTANFEGQLALQPGGARRYRGGGTIDPAHLCRSALDLVCFSDRVDPDTGELGRLGRITGVSYDGTADRATVQINNRRATFDALLARFGALLGEAA